MIKKITLALLFFGVVGCEPSRPEADPWKVDKLAINPIDLMEDDLKSGDSVHLSYPIQFISNGHGSVRSVTATSTCRLGSTHLGHYKSTVGTFNEPRPLLHFIPAHWWSKIVQHPDQSKLICSFHWTAENKNGSKHHFNRENINISISESVNGLTISDRPVHDSLFYPYGIGRSSVGSNLQIRCTDITLQSERWSNTTAIEEIYNEQFGDSLDHNKKIMELPIRNCRAIELQGKRVVSVSQPFQLQTQVAPPSIRFEQVPVENGTLEVGRRELHQWSYRFAQITIENPHPYKVAIRMGLDQFSDLQMIESKNRAFLSKSVNSILQLRLENAESLFESETYQDFALNPGGKVKITLGANTAKICPIPFGNTRHHRLQNYIVLPRPLEIDLLTSASLRTPLRTLEISSPGESFCFGPQWGSPILEAMPAYSNKCKVAQEYFTRLNESRHCWTYE